MANPIPKEFLYYAKAFPMVIYQNRQKAQNQAWNDPKVKEWLSKNMANATDAQKWEAIKQISEPEADKASREEFAAKRKEYRSRCLNT